MFVLQDMSNDGLARGIGQVEDGVAKSVKRKKVSQLEGEKFISSLVGTIDYDRFKEVRTIHSTYKDEYKLDTCQRFLIEIVHSTG